MDLHDTIERTITQLLETNGTEIENKTTNKKFVSLVSNADFVAEFTIGDQDTEEGIQGTTLCKDLPETGNIISVEGKTYKVNKIRHRTGSPIGRFYAELKKQKR